MQICSKHGVIITYGLFRPLSAVQRFITQFKIYENLTCRIR